MPATLRCRLRAAYDDVVACARGTARGSEAGTTLGTERGSSERPRLNWPCCPSEYDLLFRLSGRMTPCLTEARATKVVTTDRVNAPLRRKNGGRRELLRVAQKVRWRDVESARHPLDGGEPEIPLCGLQAADPRAVHAAGATERPHRQALSLALAAHVQSERLGEARRRHRARLIRAGSAAILPPTEPER